MSSDDDLKTKLNDLTNSTPKPVLRAAGAILEYMKSHYYKKSILQSDKQQLANIISKYSEE